MSAFSHPIRNSRLLPALAAAGKPPFRARPLFEEEVVTLQRQGCRSSNWDLVRAAPDFRTDRIFDVEFRGEVLLGRFYGTVEIEGIQEPAGLARTVLENVWIDDGAVIRDTLLLANFHVGPRSAVVGCGTVVHAPGSNFGVGSQIALVETGGRVTRSFPEMTIEDAALTARTRNIPGLAEHLRRIEACAARAASEFGVIEAGALLLSTPRVSNAFIGQGARIVAAQRVSDSVVLSDAFHPAVIEDGSIVARSAIQPGCRVAGHAFVEDSVLCEFSSVEKHGKVHSSIIGPNSAVAEGEVTSSLIGPFVGFHHQALLIGVVWPEGKGNVAYGCNCGSNHTGKAPDQEFWPGEGMFLGLGVNVKFPGSFVEAPYTTVATGVTLLPQRVEFPFSLILDPAERPEGIPEGFNEIVPAWALSHNLFAIKRSEHKFRERDRSLHSHLDHRVFRREIVELMLSARSRLERTEGGEVYTEQQISGLGKNFMRESVRETAVQSYRFHAVAYALEGLFHRLEEKGSIAATVLKHKSTNEEWEYQRRIIAEETSLTDPKEALLHYLELLRLMAREIEASKARDDERGRRIIPDYSDHHLLAHEHPFVWWFHDQVEAIEDRVLDLLE